MLDARAGRYAQANNLTRAAAWQYGPQSALSQQISRLERADAASTERAEISSAPGAAAPGAPGVGGMTSLCAHPGSASCGTPSRWKVTAAGPELGNGSVKSRKVVPAAQSASTHSTCSALGRSPSPSPRSRGHDGDGIRLPRVWSAARPERWPERPEGQSIEIGHPLLGSSSQSVFDQTLDVLFVSPPRLRESPGHVRNSSLHGTPRVGMALWGSLDRIADRAPGRARRTGGPVPEPRASGPWRPGGSWPASWGRRRGPWPGWHAAGRP